MIQQSKVKCLEQKIQMKIPKNPSALKNSRIFGPLEHSRLVFPTKLNFDINAV
jgi:hypothetical protein